MAISVRNSEVEALARELAARSGRGMTDEILEALKERSERLSGQISRRRDAIRSISARCATLPVLDGRSADEILGYGPTGAF